MCVDRARSPRASSDPRSESTVSLESEKAALRVELIAACRELAPETVARHSRRVANRLPTVVQYAAAKLIGLYAAIDGEISTRPIFEAAVSAGQTCVFPRCLAGNRLEFAEIRAWEDLEPGRFGILEPAAHLPIRAIEQLDVILVPGVGFDREGNRLGRGGGFYDRTLPADRSSPPFSIGLGHSFQLLEQLPVRNYDRKVNEVVTN